MTRLKSAIAAVSAMLLIVCSSGCDRDTMFKLKISANPQNGGSVVPDGTIKYNAGTEVRVTATPAGGYRFIGWSGASSATTPSVTVTMNCNQTLIAGFQLIPVFNLEVSANPPYGGAVTPDGTTKYKEETEVKATATPADGYKFIGWSGASADTTPFVTVTMNSNQTLTANFQLIPTFKLNISANPPSGGTVTPNETAAYRIGTEVDATARPNAGYWFVGWSGSLTTKTPSVTVTMNSNQTLTANFRLIADSFTDSRDSKNRQHYRTVRINNRTWMAENLNFKTGNFWCYKKSENNCKKYGRLYDWNTAASACPTGWRLPDNNDWNDLIQAADSKDAAGKKLKSRTGWDNNGNGTDDLGFSALPGGVRLSDGDFRNLGSGGYWWSATEYYESNHAYCRRINSGDEYVNEHDYHRNYGASVRCVQD